MNQLALSSRERFLVLMAVDRMALFYDGAAARERPLTQERRDMDNAAQAARELRDQLYGSPAPFNLSNDELALLGRALRMLSGAVLRRIALATPVARRGRLRALSEEVSGVEGKTRAARGLPT